MIGIHDDAVLAHHEQHARAIIRAHLAQGELLGTSDAFCRKLGSNVLPNHGEATCVVSVDGSFEVVDPDRGDLLRLRRGGQSGQADFVWVNVGDRRESIFCFAQERVTGI